MSSIELTGLTREFGGTRALDTVDLDIDHGEFVVFLGPSGCGKSTLLRLIAGLIEPTAGTVGIDGRDVTGLPPRDRGLAMVFQSYALYPHLSVAKNIAFPLRARRIRRDEIAERVARTAASVHLDDFLDRRPADLSGGQRQRVALARAMVQNPGAYLMDEPLSNLDAQLRSATRAELIDLHRRLGSTFLYVTHDQVEAMSMATRIVLLNGGRVEQVGTPDDLYDRPRSTFVAAFLGAPPMCLFDATIGAQGGEVVLRAGNVEIPLGLPAPHHHAPQRVTAGIRPEKLRLDAHGAIATEVRAVENHGSDEVVHLDLGTTSLQARVSRPSGARTGDRVRIGLEADDLHLFDPGTGRRMRWTGPAESADPPSPGASHFPRSIMRSTTITRHTCAVIALWTAALLALSACSMGAPARESSSAEVPELAPDQKVTIVFESYNYGLAGAWTDTFNALIADFSSKYPNITVKAQKPQGNSPNPARDAISSVQQQSVAGNPPDVAQLGFGDFGFVVDQLGAQPLSTLFGRDEVEQTFGGQHPYASSVRGLAVSDDVTYGIPFVMSTPVFYYNADLFRRAGLDPDNPPGTWDEVRAAATAIAATTGKGGVYVDCLTKSATDWCYQALVGSAGGQVISDDRSTLSFADPAAVEVTGMARQLVETGATPAYTQQQGYEAFTRGDMGMILESSSMQTTFLKGAAGKWELRAAEMPAFGDKPTVPTNSGVALYTFASDPARQRAAWQLIRYLTGNEAFTTIAKGIGYLPLRTGLVDDPAYLADWADENRGLLDPNLRQLQRLTPWVSMPGNSYKQIQGNLMTAVEKIVYQNADPMTTLAEAQRLSTSLMPAQ